MTRLNLKPFRILLLLLLTSSFNYAQKAYEVNVNESKVIIEGTSNIHDWEMTVEKLKSTLKLNSESEKDIASINFQVPVKSMKSGKNRMDKNTYEALKEEDHETITFNSTSVEYSNDNYYATGTLSIAGVTKEVKIPFDLTNQNNQINLRLNYEINMTDYKVEPPTALFGTITTGEKVNVNINLIFK